MNSRLTVIVLTLIIALNLSCSAADQVEPIIIDSAPAKAAPSQKPVFIDPLSVRSLYVIMSKGNKKLGMATGFVVEKDGKYYLITNWHVLSGRNPQTNQPFDKSGDTPDRIHVIHHAKKLGTWVVKPEMLYDKKGKKKWIEHKKGRAVDVVALPLTSISKDVQIYPLDLALADADVVPQVAMPVSIIGFPLGLTSARVFPIWKTGHIASDPDLDYNSEPLFLIDATTRGGMSGSPVVLRVTGGYKTRSGATVYASGSVTLFLGVYSGRLPGDSEIGRVWRPRLIREILP